MKPLNLSLALALAIALAACSSSSAPSRGTAGAAAPPASATGQSGAGLQGLPLEGPVEVPESVGWNNPGVSKEQNRADLESCYRYSRGQVQHDILIEDDRATLRGDDLGIGYVQLNRSMNEFDFRNRKETLFEDCMESRGYASN